MLRTRLNEALKAAMKARDERGTSTLRLMLAALKDRDIAARTKGVTNGIADEDIFAMLQSMARQCRDSMTLYEQGNRPDLVQKEAEEILIIESFLPRQMSACETAALARTIIAETGAAGLKDMGKVMAVLKERFAGQMDFSKASGIVKDQLS